MLSEDNAMKNKDVSDLIKELRDKLDLTQEQFVQEVEVTFSTINNWEKGTRTAHHFYFRNFWKWQEKQAYLSACGDAQAGGKFFYPQDVSQHC